MSFDCLSSDFRKKLYLATVPILSQPRSADPKNHTMKEPNFLDYIGRLDAKGLESNSKKFSDKQREMIASAFAESTNIHVVGALRSDIQLILEIFDYKEIENSRQLFERRKAGRIFNVHRQSMAFVNKKSTGERILLVIVFPSRQYVDQVSELILAIISDYHSKNLVESSTQVGCTHFPEVEDNLVKWTGFDEGIRRFVRYGDVVVIGNLEFLIPGLQDIGFHGRGWQFFGIEKAFGVNVFVSASSKVRIVLVGFKECFWGEASSKYALAIAEAGAKHILYGSKAASLISSGKVHRILSPTSFLNIGYHDGEERIEHKGNHYSDLFNIFDIFDIGGNGVAVTVPTVIGETFEQRQLYDDANPACMDCEDGHVAGVIREFNKSIDELGAGFNDYVKFVPVHFITDYIYREGEAFDEKNPALNTHDNNTAYRDTRNKIFRKIGRLFGIYALKFGIKDLIQFPAPRGGRALAGDPLDVIMEGVRPYIDAGLGYEALSTLLSIHRKSSPPNNILLAMAMVAQKCGFIDFAHGAIDELLQRNESKGLGQEDLLRVSVVKLKYLTQVGDHCTARNLAQGLLSGQTVDMLRKIKQFGAVNRRLAISNSAVGDFEGANTYLQAAREAEQNKIDPHYKQTNEIFAWIALLHQSPDLIPGGMTGMAQTLSSVRRQYIAQMATKVEWWQTNLEKCAIAAIFLEAAFYLEFGGSQYEDDGMKCLYAAHLLNVRLGGNECSETYGEIVSAIRDRTTRLMMVLAMKRDMQGQIEFHNMIMNKNKGVQKIGDTWLDLLRCDPIGREDVVQKILGAD